MQNKTITLNFGGLLGIIFVIAKLTGHLDWSWLWVLAPFWLPLAVFLGFLVVGFVVWILALLIAGIFGR